MGDSLLAQIIADAGSIREACKVIDIPRSTLSAVCQDSCSVSAVA
ncbi:hypothetical protein ENSA7_66430 [Enhygromyxa salina]|uniref:Uncharacterized protein n=1 Tax=Enhygromyxa salina TaxID=215803 RepID=A0A2S9XWS4_9BACT|nr:hypothetical protein ENSA7_66430 [Enhygromyxa salina]